MIIGDFEILIGSPIDKEKLIGEIHYKNEVLAEISQESGDFLIEIYPSMNNKWWSLSLDNFQRILEISKQHLQGIYRNEQQ